MKGAANEPVFQGKVEKGKLILVAIPS